MANHATDAGGSLEPRSFESTSPTLLLRAKAHDQDAWRRLVAIYTPSVYRWCRQAGLSCEDARDVGQDVFLRVASNLARFRRDRPGDSFRGWLWTITRNKIRDHFRRPRLHADAQGGTDAAQRLAELPDDVSNSASERDSNDEECLVLHRVLEAIRPRFEPRSWQAFWRTTVQNEAGKEVAADLDMSVPAVYQAKYRVLQRIRAEWDDLR